MASIHAPKKSMIKKFVSWSASRLDDYDRCPLFAKWKHLDKLCTICFDGKLKGGFDTPAVCDACNGTPKKGPALERGGVIGDKLDKFLLNRARTMGDTIVHPEVKKIVMAARLAIKKGLGNVQISLRFTKEWEVIPGDGYDPRAWLYTKLDYREHRGGDRAHVTDWKTGGVDKSTGEVKVADKYDLQLLTYQVATLVSCPAINTVSTNLVFLDCKVPHDPVLDRPDLQRKDLKEAQTRLAKKILPMMSDTDFAAKSSHACGYCDYAKKKGGPCKFGG